jgi:hypothetical protein
MLNMIRPNFIKFSENQQDRLPPIFLLFTNFQTLIAAHDNLQSAPSCRTTHIVPLPRAQPLSAGVNARNTTGRSFHNRKSIHQQVSVLREHETLPLKDHTA